MGDTQYVKNPLGSPMEKPNTHGMEYRSLSKNLGVYVNSDNEIKYAVEIVGNSEVFLARKCGYSGYTFNNSNFDIQIEIHNNKQSLSTVIMNRKKNKLLYYTI